MSLFEEVRNWVLTVGAAPGHPYVPPEAQERNNKGPEHGYARSASSARVPAAMVASYPPVSLWEDDDFVYAETMIPGEKLSDLNITVTVIGDDSHLTIAGVRKKVNPDNVVWHCRERGYGPFQRTIDLPVPMEATQADAVLDEGVLTIKMAKSPQAKPKRIPVKADESHSHIQ